MPGSRSAPSASRPSAVARRSGGNCQRDGGGSTGTPRTLCQHPDHGGAARTRRAARVGGPARVEQPARARGRGRAPTCAWSASGGSGLAAVGAATAAGASVVGLDAGPVGGGAAGRNGGFLLAGGALFHHAAAAAWGHERAVALYAATLAEMDRLERELGGAIVRRVGSLRDPGLARGGRGLRAAARGADPRRLPRGAAPPGRPATGCSSPTTGRSTRSRAAGCSPRASLHGGARLFCGSPALEVRGDRVTCPGGAVRCRAVLVTVDGGLEQLLPEVAGRARSTRLQMLAHRAGRARHGAAARVRQLGLRLLAAAPRRPRGAGRRPRPLRRRRVGPPAPSRTRRSRRGSTACCASAPASTRP